MDGAHLNRGAAWLAIALGGAPAASLAADAAAQAVDSMALGEIIVTAQKRAQNVQDVPLAVSAFGEADLQARQINHASELQWVVPGLVIGNPSEITPQVTLRGVGTGNALPGGDPGVPIHLDGHYLQASRFVVRDMLDVERVEVLRGPQGTLYGRNAIGGSINIVSKRPTSTPEGMLAVDVGNYSLRKVEAVASGPLSERLRGRVAIADEKRDGYVRNISPRAPNRTTLDSDYTSIRASFELDVTPDFQVYGGAFHLNDDGAPIVWAVQGDFVNNANPTFASLPDTYVNPTNTDPFTIRQDTPNSGFDRARGAFLDADWKTGLGTVRSLSAYTTSKTGYVLDLDATDATPPVTYDQNVRYQTFSQELQLVSDRIARTDLIAGLYYYQEKSRFFRQFSAPRAVYGIDFSYRYDPEPQLEGKSLGAFVNADYRVTDRVTFTLGGRYTRDQKHMLRGYAEISNDLGGTLSAGATDQSTDWSRFTGRAALTYQPTDSATLYASFANGYKSGGYNPISLRELSYDPETVRALEIGAKTEWLDDRIRANLAIFQSDYRNKQEYVANRLSNASSEIAIRNAAAATIRGVELEGVVRITPRFRIDGNVSYLDAAYDSFLSEDSLRPQLGVLQLEGNRLPNSPEWKFAIGGEGNWPMPGNFGSLATRVEYAWTQGYFSDAFNRVGDPVTGGISDRVPSHEQVNGSVQWLSTSGDWSAVAYVKNATDSRAPTWLQPTYHGNTFAIWQIPRSYGVKVTRRF
jgi:iron complex outermembrane receptor protein